MSRAASSSAPDAATKLRAKKVWQLCEAARTEGEVRAGKAWIKGAAAWHQMTPHDFVAACGLSKPRVRVKAIYRAPQGQGLRVGPERPAR